MVKIGLPALRERKDDIPILIEHFIRKFNLLKGRSIQGVTPETLSFLLGQPFPGNIRQLANIIEYTFITCKEDVIDMEHLPKDLVKVQEDQHSLLSSNEYEEAEKIRAILEQYPQNRPEAARVLGMSRTTLWRKMKKYGIMDA